MVGGGSRRDEGSLVINNTNVFAALETLRKKKKSDKDRKSKGSSKSAQSAQPKAPEAQVFWAPAPLNAKSWADVDDEDDDDYYATTAPPQSVWGPSEPHQNKDRPNVEVRTSLNFIFSVDVWYLNFVFYSLVCLIFVH